MVNFTGPRANQIRTSNQQPDLAQWMRDVDKRTGHFGGRVATRLGLSSLIPFEDLQVFIDDEKKYVVFKNGTWEDILGGGGGGTGGGGTGTIDPAIEGRVASLEMQVSNISKDYTEDFITQNKVDLGQTTAVLEPGRIRARKIPGFTDPLDSDIYIDPFGTSDVVIKDGHVKLAQGKLEGYLVSNPIAVNKATQVKVDALITQHSGMGFLEGSTEILNKIAESENLTHTVMVDDNAGRQWRVMFARGKNIYVECLDANGVVIISKTITTAYSLRLSDFLNPAVVVDQDNKVWIICSTSSGTNSNTVAVILNPDGTLYKPIMEIVSAASSALFYETSNVVILPNRRVLIMTSQSSSGSTGALVLWLYELDGTLYKSTTVFTVSNMSLRGLDAVYDKANNKVIWAALQSTVMQYGAIDLDGTILSASRSISTVGNCYSLHLFYNETFQVARVYASQASAAIRVLDINASTVTATLVGSITNIPLPNARPMKGIQDGNQYSLVYTSTDGSVISSPSVVYYIKLGHTWNEVIVPATQVTHPDDYKSFYPSIFYNKYTNKIEVYTSTSRKSISLSVIEKFIYKTEQTKVDVDVSPDNGLTWLPVTLGNYSVFSNPVNNVRVRFKLISPVTTTWGSPEVSQYQITDIANSLEEKVATFVSSKLPSLSTVANIILTVDQQLNNGTTQWFASNDGGANWYPVGIGQRYTFPNRLNGDLRIKVIITSPVGEPTSPIVKGYTVITGNTVMGVDLEEIEANIAKTNFRFAALLNISKYSLKNMFIDTFADSSGIDSVKTNGVHVSQGSLLLVSAGVNVAPKLLSNTSNPPVIVTESSSSGAATGGWRLFDQLTGNWQTNNGDVSPDKPEWMQIDFGIGNDKKIDAYTLVPYNTASRIYDPKDFKLQGSHNAYEWTTIDIRTGQTWLDATDKKTFTVGTPGFYRYYRLLVEETTGTTVSIIGEMELFSMGTGTGIGTVYSAPEETGTVPSKVFLVVDETLNTGTITYEASRDNGVSWKSIEKEKLLDVSDQPNGTKLVLRATITGNALLHSWALSWK